MTTEKVSLSTKNGKTVYKIDKVATHTIYKNKANKRVPGVTTILGFINKGDALLKWAYECGLQNIDYKKEKDKAADIGTIAHAMCECYIKGWELDTSNLAPDDVDKAENAFLKFVEWWDDEGFELVESEQPLVSEELQVGGTIDIVARDPKGRLVLIDLKTSKYIYAEYKLQVSAYAFIYEENKGQKISKIIICRIGKEVEGDFEHRTITDRKEALKAFISTKKAREDFAVVNKF